MALQDHEIRLNGNANGGGEKLEGHSLVRLSAQIARLSATVHSYLQSQGLPQPSTKADGPVRVLSLDAPAEVRQAREGLLAATLELRYLVAGPSEWLPNLGIDFGYLPCLTWACEYDVFHKIPLDESPGISYDALAAEIHAPVPRVKSLVRMLMTASLFRESPCGTHVSHSATSAFLARDDDAFTYACWLCERTGPMAMAMTAAQKRFGAGSTSVRETAFNVAFGTELPFFEYFQQLQGKDEGGTGGFARFMRATRSSDAVALGHLVRGFEWERVRADGVVVDVGGSTGDAAVALASAHSHLHFVVQDLADNVEAGRANVPASQPAEIAERISFSAYDFMLPQHIHGADVYLLRMILHDWPDDKAIQILSCQASAMEKDKSRLLIMDMVLPKPGSVPVSAERFMRSRDMTMMQAFNSRERERGDWEALIAAARPRLELIGVRYPVGSALAILEVGLSA